MRERGLDPPAVNMSMSSSPSGSEDEDEKYDAPIATKASIVATGDAVVGTDQAPFNASNSTIQSEPELTPEGSEGEGEAVAMDESDDEESDDDEEDSDEEEDGNDNTPKSKRVSYSKDMLKPTKEGSLISKGVDVRAASQSKVHKPGYIDKQLKATGYGDDLKKGAAVPRDQPEDPNAKLGDMYKAVKLKQGARDESVSTKSTAKMQPAYASVTLKKAANPEETRKKSDESSSPTILQSVKLNKAEPIVKKETRRSSFPDVKLNKTELVVKDSAKHFELPQEFSQAKQNLKRRTERHWYSNGVPEAKPSKKWFFQKGEWNDGKEPKPKYTSPKESTGSWFFGGSSSSTTPTSLGNIDSDNKPGAHSFRGSHTRITTGKDLVKTQHFNELMSDASNNSNNKKSLKTKYSKQYYEDLQRRRKGLPPKHRRGFLCTFFVWFIVVPGMLGSAFLCGRTVFPDHFDAAWKHVQPTVEPVLQQLKPHIEEAFGIVKPHAASALQQVQPHVKEAVDRVCSSVESFELVDDYDKKWTNTIHASGITVCTMMRSKLGMTPEEEIGESLESSLSDNEETVTAGSTEPTNSKRKESSQKVENSEECECDAGSKRPRWKRLLPGGKKERHQECCNKEHLATTSEKEL